MVMEKALDQMYSEVDLHVGQPKPGNINIKNIVILTQSWRCHCLLLLDPAQISRIIVAVVIKSLGQLMNLSMN